MFQQYAWQISKKYIDKGLHNKTHNIIQIDTWHVCTHFANIFHVNNTFWELRKSENWVDPDYYTSLLSNNSANPRHMWNSVNKILHREKSKPLPDYTSLDTLCSSFSKFFTDKITLIRSNCVTNDHSHDFPEPPHVENTMNQFAPTTTSEVRTIKCFMRS